jgi:biopolymer transport protein TolR
MAMRRYKKNKRTVLTDIPLTPLIDTALTLLVIFIVIAPSMRHGLNVTLPKTDLQYQSAVDDIVITIDKNGNYFWQKDIIAPEFLSKMISVYAQKNDCKTVFIRADKDVIYDAVLQLFQILSGIDGIEDVVLPTEKL